MKTWDSFYPDVLPSVMGCPDPVMNHALLRAAQEFFRRTHVWTLWLDTIRTAGRAEYDIPLEDNTELVKLQRATLQGRQIAVIAPETLPADWKTSPSGLRSCVFTRDRKVLTLLPITSTAELLRIEASLQPSNSATGIPDEFFDLYVEAIAHGAKARIQRLAGTAFYNPQYAMDCEEMFKQAIGSIAIQQYRAFSSAAPRQKIKTF